MALLWLPQGIGSWSRVGLGWPQLAPHGGARFEGHGTLGANNAVCLVSAGLCLHLGHRGRALSLPLPIIPALTLTLTLTLIRP